MNVLLVDDSKAMRLIVRRALREAGFGAHEFVEANNGAEALAAIAQRPPDLVLSDWNMPEMLGIDLLTSLRSQGSTVQFGFVTSEGSDEMRNRARAAGASFFITKPFSPDDLAKALRPILGGGS